MHWNIDMARCRRTATILLVMMIGSTITLTVAALVSATASGSVMSESIGFLPATLWSGLAANVGACIDPVRGDLSTWGLRLAVVLPIALCAPIIPWPGREIPTTESRITMIGLGVFYAVLGFALELLAIPWLDIAHWKLNYGLYPADSLPTRSVPLNEDGVLLAACVGAVAVGAIRIIMCQPVIGVDRFITVVRQIWLGFCWLLVLSIAVWAPLFALRMHSRLFEPTLPAIRCFGGALEISVVGLCAMLGPIVLTRWAGHLARSQKHDEDTSIGSAMPDTSDAGIGLPPASLPA